MVNLTEQLERTVFHDAELWKCSSDGDVLTLYFRNISLEIGKEQYYSASVVLRGVREIRRNDESVPEMKLEGESSDVLQFRRGEGKALLLIEWHYFRLRADVFTRYEIDYDTFSMAAEKQDELIV